MPRDEAHGWFIQIEEVHRSDVFVDHRLLIRSGSKAGEWGLASCHLSVKSVVQKLPASPAG